MRHINSDLENKLIAGCKEQDRGSQRALYKMFYGRMLAICMRYTKNKESALEVLNDAFLKVFLQIHQYKASGPLGGWIRKIVLYTSIDYVRKNNNYEQNFDLDSSKDIETESDAIERLSAQELMSAIQQISPASQSVFSLYIIEGYSHKEIATMLDISSGTSKWHLSNARKELQKIISKNNNYLVAL